MNPHDRTGAGTPYDAFTALRATDSADHPIPLAPDPDFARRLRERLERGARLPEGVIVDTTALEHELSSTATEPAATTPVVERPGALPYLAVADGRAAIDWYVTHLGAHLRGDPILMDDNRIGHAELEMGGGVVYLAQEFPDMGLRAPAPGHVSVSLMLAVDDTDSALDRARRGDAIVSREPYEAHGTRTAVIVDPFGHRWMLTGPMLSAAPDPDRIHVGDIGFVSVQTHDVTRAARFYGAVLGWEFDAGTRRVTNAAHPLAIVHTDGPQTVFCAYAVDDLDAARTAVERAGGRAVDDPHGLDAIDDQGVEFAVYTPEPGDERPEQHPRDVGGLSYLTVHTPDSARLRAFYRAVLGWTFRPGRIEDGWEVDDVHPQIGIAGGADESVAVPMWNVTDVDTAVERVRAAGGTVIDEPSRQPYGATALCADDQGARFYLGQLF
ncbi:glyoxalase [Gordonia desulfuricans]|uniref:Glyoxalase n=1 Tax=Gordonia desulfuricans TaxID=89051 RepID=A0A7K3LNT1_9ACTN|nr:VOC family protein [Gordonia desulfuricans]NDK89207.1 glyoxalase [Gordonia desulfuricans]